MQGEGSEGRGGVCVFALPAKRCPGAPSCRELFPVMPAAFAGRERARKIPDVSASLVVEEVE